MSGISPEALELLKRYPWPGNIRELKNIIERVLILETGERIEVDDLPPEITHHVEESHAATLAQEFPLTGLSLEDVEKELIRKALSMAHGNQTRAAELLGISRDTLRYRLQKFGLK